MNTGLVETVYSIAGPEKFDPEGDLNLEIGEEPQDTSTKSPSVSDKLVRILLCAKVMTRTSLFMDQMLSGHFAESMQGPNVNGRRRLQLPHPLQSSWPCRARSTLTAVDIKCSLVATDTQASGRLYLTFAAPSYVWPLEERRDGLVWELLSRDNIYLLTQGSL
jgi:hypothetical protein